MILMNENIIDPEIMSFVYKKFVQNIMKFKLREGSANNESVKLEGSNIIEAEYEVIDIIEAEYEVIDDE